MELFSSFTFTPCYIWFSLVQFFDAPFIQVFYPFSHHLFFFLVTLFLHVSEGRVIGYQFFHDLYEYSSC